MSEKKIAVLFDCENISAKYIQDVFDKLASYGEIVIKQAFFDWKKDSNWNQEIIEEYAIESIQVFNNKNLKNTSDLKIQRYALEILYQKPHINIIAIVSSDSDFRDLAMNICANGCEAIGFGEKKTLRLVRNAYSMFFQLPLQNEIQTQDVDSITMNLKKAIQAKSDENGYCLVAEVGKYLRNINSSYIPQNYGTNAWGKYFRNFPDIFELKNESRKGKNDTLLVRLKLQ